MEEFKNIPGTNGFYSCDRKGNIKSNERTIYRTSTPQRIKERILKPKIDTRGYKAVALNIDKKRISCCVHQLVARTWIPNPNNYPCINHIDNDRTNNCVENLEWCTFQHNSLHAFNQGRLYPIENHNPPTPVDQFDLEGNYIQTFRTITEAAIAVTGKEQSRRHIAECCKGIGHSSYGYKWKYSKQQSTSND